MKEIYERIADELVSARKDYKLMNDDTRYYDGKIDALEEVCRILHISVPDEPL